MENYLDYLLFFFCALSRLLKASMHLVTGFRLLYSRTSHHHFGQQGTVHRSGQYHQPDLHHPSRFCRQRHAHLLELQRKGNKLSKGVTPIFTLRIAPHTYFVNTTQWLKITENCAIMIFELKILKCDFFQWFFKYSDVLRIFSFCNSVFYSWK